MKYIKTLGLLAVAAAALMVFASPASATLRSATSGSELANGTVIKASAGTTYLTGPWADVSCTGSSFEGKLTANNANHAAGSVSKLTFSGCNYEVTVKNAGSLTLENTTVRSFNAEIIVHTSVGACTFKTGTSGVIIGMLEDTHVTGGAARMNINNSKIPVSGSFLCSYPETSYGEWEGSYTISSPNPLYED
jgi:hypothetical protein